MITIKQIADELAYFTENELNKALPNWNNLTEDVKSKIFVTLLTVDDLRDIVEKTVNSKVYFNIIDICNLGHTANSMHYKGEAIDVFIGGFKLTNYLINRIICKAIDIGFFGVGVYCNKASVYSFHFDTRDYMAIWAARKNDVGGWNYSQPKWDY